MIRSKNIIAIPPGATIKEQLEDRDMTQKEFAARMEMSEKHISRLINGEVILTSNMAVRLEMVLGLPARFWSALEAEYRESIEKANAENEMDADIEEAKKFPYKEMADFGWVPEVKKAEEKVINLRKFFEVVRLGLLNENLPGIACRRLANTEKADYALLAWAQKAKIEARKIEVSPIDLKNLKGSIGYFRSMTKMDPAKFCPLLEKKLADCGIAIIYLPHIKGSFLHGATFFDKDKIVLGLTVRGKDSDKFWFSFFHEIGHILLGHISQKEVSEEDENAANEFAQEVLIPSKAFEAFMLAGDISRNSIVNFSKSIEISPGIVVGRLQKQGFLSFANFNDLKSKYMINVH